MPSSVKSIAPVIAKGDHAKSLVALRDRLACEIDAAESARDVATLTGQLTAVLAQIAAIQKPTTTKRDEIARKRAERQRAAASGGRSGATDSDNAAVGDERG